MAFRNRLQPYFLPILGIYNEGTGAGGDELGGFEKAAFAPTGLPQHRPRTNRVGQQPAFLTATTTTTNRGGDFYNSHHHHHQQQQQFQLQQQVPAVAATNYYQNQAAVLEAAAGPMQQQQHPYASGNAYANAIESATVGLSDGLQPPPIYACE